MADVALSTDWYFKLLSHDLRVGFVLCESFLSSDAQGKEVCQRLLS
jgi:hypothetical protein